ncbi:ash family protein [Salinisphaera sp. G21_0]|nr:ash family protein [Salinisphaera sp. G21_0]
MKRELNNLPIGGYWGYASNVAAKSATRLDLRQTFKAYSRNQRFFCAYFQHTCPFMAGLLGASSDAPVSLNAGKVNPDNSATNPDVDLSAGGSTIQGACPMAIACRLALLEGNHSRLSGCRVRGYLSLSFTSYQQAKATASSLNAVLSGWSKAPQRPPLRKGSNHSPLTTGLPVQLKVGNPSLRNLKGGNPPFRDPALIIPGAPSIHQQTVRRVQA